MPPSLEERTRYHETHIRAAMRQVLLRRAATWLAIATCAGTVLTVGSRKGVQALLLRRRIGQWASTPDPRHPKEARRGL
jgi:hypothetical protein